ncbi:MAG TPA: DUF4391 domain-containing protein [Paludibaculum sp.]|jgi:hypothetical protein
MQPRVIVNHTEVKRVLDLVRGACKGRGDPIPEAYLPFNLVTQDGREMRSYSELLAQAIRPMIDIKEEKDLDSLFSSPRDNRAGQSHRRPRRLRAHSLSSCPGVCVNPPMFDYPKQAEFNHVIPKAKIYSFAKPTRAVRDRFVSQVAEIVWKYKLSPETVNLPARHGIQEIQIFAVALKAAELAEDVLRAMDRAIPSPSSKNN